MTAAGREELGGADTSAPGSHGSGPVPPATFTLLRDGPAPGPWNMAVDEVLLNDAATSGQCSLRFYRWSEPTLSLGYFQTYADRWQHEASSRCTAVRRMSGGGAIMHDIELTYSFAVPSHHPLAIDRLRFYQAVHSVLIDVLAHWGIEAVMVGEDRGMPCSLSPADAKATGGRKREPFLCFERRAAGDVLVGGAKIAGSAQRRCQGAVLQHGSVLLARSLAAPELSGLKELADKTISADELVDAWLARLSDALPLIWQTGKLTENQIHRARALADEKYASAKWTENRGRS